MLLHICSGVATNGADRKIHGLLGQGVCDFENVKRYNVIM